MLVRVLSVAPLFIRSTSIRRIDARSLSGQLVFKLCLIVVQLQIEGGEGQPPARDREPTPPAPQQDTLGPAQVRSQLPILWLYTYGGCS